MEDHNKARRYIAYHHWHEAILKEAYQNGLNGVSYKIPYKINKTLKDVVGLEDASKVGGGLYWNIPTQNLDLITATFNECKMEIDATKIYQDIINELKINKSLDNNTTAENLLNNKTGLTLRLKKLVRDKLHENEVEEEKEKLKRISMREKIQKRKRTQLLFDNSAAPVKKKLKLMSKKIRRLKLKLNTLQLENLVYKNTFSIVDDCINRLNISNNEWHNKYPHLCRYLFGFPSWSELKKHLHILFDIDVNISKDVIIGKKGRLLPFEQALMWLLRNKRGLEHEMLARIFNLTSFQRVSDILLRWSPKFEKVGEYLSLLDVPDQYFKLSLPRDYVNDERLKSVAILLDGKDFPIETIRNNSALNRSQWSDKIKSSAIRYIASTLPNGLAWWNSPPCWGRASEQSHMSLLGYEPEEKQYF